MKSMIGLTNEEIETLLKGLDLLVEDQQDSVNYTELYKKLHSKDRQVR